jgi:hypothetical protein
MDYSVHDIMKTRRRVLLFGDTLLLASLRVSLLSYSGLDVLDVTDSVASEEELLTLHPDVVIFDVAGEQPTILHNLTEALPDLLLIGIDPSHSRGLVWSRHQLQELSTSDLVGIIERFSSQDT